MGKKLSLDKGGKSKACQINFSSKLLILSLKQDEDKIFRTNQQRKCYI